jgi:hypothetical protein
VVTCSAETIVPWMTSRSTPADSAVGASCSVCCGETRTAVVTPASRISLIRAVISSGLTGSQYTCCSSDTGGASAPAASRSLR